MYGGKKKKGKRDRGSHGGTPCRSLGIVAAVLGVGEHQRGERGGQKKRLVGTFLGICGVRREKGPRKKEKGKGEGGKAGKETGNSARRAIPVTASHFQDAKIHPEYCGAPHRNITEKKKEGKTKERKEGKSPPWRSVERWLTPILLHYIDEGGESVGGKKRQGEKTGGTIIPALCEEFCCFERSMEHWKNKQKVDTKKKKGSGAGETATAFFRIGSPPNQRRRLRKGGTPRKEERESNNTRQ